MVKIVHKLEILSIVILIVLIILVVGKYYNTQQTTKTFNTPSNHNFVDNPEWKYLWGSLSIENNNLIVKSSAFIYSTNINRTNGNFTLKLKNYNGKSISLNSLLINKSTYTSCVFNKNYLAITNTINGEEQVLRKIPLPGQNYKVVDNTTLIMKTKGRYVQCFINEKPVIQYKNNPMSQSGGIGIKINSDQQTSITSILI